MTLDEELQGVPKLLTVGRAIIEFTKALAEGDFEKQRSGKWVYRKPNFVAMKVQPQAENLRVTIYGNWRTLKEIRDSRLGFTSEQFGSWCGLLIDNPIQLAAALNYIDLAFKLHSNSTRQRIKYKNPPSKRSE